MFDGDFDRDAERLSERLDGFADDPDGLRDAFLQRHVHKLYAELTDNGNDGLRADDLVYAAAERVPGLAPSWAEVARERERLQKDKEGYEVAQGTLLGHVLANEDAGRHLIDVMLRPTQLALDHQDEFERTGRVDLGTAAVTRTGNVGTVELRNPRHLNAEDDSTTGPFEAGIDLLILDAQVEIAVLRGGVVEHPRYAGRRIFGAGLNLTRLYRGLIPYLFFLVRDLGFVNKIHAGLSGPEHRPGPLEETTEKLWIAAAETYAIGGACQLLHVVDHVIAERGCRMYLPARKEGIIPGASNLRLPRTVGDRVARRAILSGREFVAGTDDLLCDEVVEAGAMDDAIAARVDALASSGLVNAAANRRALRIGLEPPDLFRGYMALFAREQAFCHFSPALVSNLERNWSAHERTI